MNKNKNLTDEKISQYRETINELNKIAQDNPEELFNILSKANNAFELGYYIVATEYTDRLLSFYTENNEKVNKALKDNKTYSKIFNKSSKEIFENFHNIEELDELISEPCERIIRKLVK